MPTRPETTAPPAGAVPAPEDEPAPSARAALEGLLGVPFTEGNQVDVLHDGAETFPALLAAIAGSRRSVDLLWFLWGKGDIGRRIADALVERAHRGLRVRVLLDAFGAQDMDVALVDRMRAAGCVVLFYRPMPGRRLTVWNMRTHRRVLVCDGTVAFTGGTGIADSWTGNGDRPLHWRDTAFRLRGPAVAGLRAAFALPWLQAVTSGRQGFVDTGDAFPPLPPVGESAVQVLRASSAPGWNEAAMAFAALLHTVRRRVRVSSPYVRLPPWLRDLVLATAARGVQVELLLSGPHVDRPSVHLQAEREYQALLDGGVEIWRFQPTLLHTKVVTVDGRTAMGGTTNFDVRSLGLNEQVCLLVDDPAVTRVLDTDLDRDLSRSERLDPSQWRRRPMRQRALERAADLVGRPLRGWAGAGLAGRRPAPS